MPRRASDSNPDGKRPCAFCRTLRVVVIFALLVVALMAYADKLDWLENIQFSDIFAYMIAVAFVVVLAFKVWEEYWKPKKHAEGREGRREEREKLFDEMDAAVAKREAEEAMHVDVESGDTLVTQVTHSDRHEEKIDGCGDLVSLDTHEVSLAVTIEHHEPSGGVLEEAEQQEADEAEQGHPQQLDIFGYEIKGK